MKNVHDVLAESYLSGAMSLTCQKVVPGAPLVSAGCGDMAAAHERTFGAIIARLEKLKYLRRAPFTPGQSQTVIYSFIGAKCAGKQPYAVYARMNRNKQWREVTDAQD
ncbi:MAG: hypothetical protein [Bacteriophage sp.]|nr:MAG: hypothetical protein [Bacteriophage sp.]